MTHTTSKIGDFSGFYFRLRHVGISIFCNPDGIRSFALPDGIQVYTHRTGVLATSAHQAVFRLLGVLLVIPQAAEEINGLGIVNITRCVQLTGVDTYSATGTGIDLYFTESVVFFALFYTPVLQENIDHFGRDVHVSGER